MTFSDAIRATLPRRDQLSPLGRLLLDLIRYGAASVVALAVDAGTLFLLNLGLGVNYLVASGIGFLCGLVVIYALSVRFVYSDVRTLRPSQEIAGFLITGVLGLALTQSLMALFVGWFALPVTLAKAPTVAAVFAFNFLSRRMLLFSIGTK